MSAPGLVETVEDGVVRWTLDHPARRNAVHPDALTWITHRCATLRGEVVILRGAGDQAFCAGFDLTALNPSADGPPPDAPLAQASVAMEAADATFVAAINGLTIGAGLELACACDVRIARDDAWFAVPAAKLGVVYHADGLRRLHAVLGPAIVRRMLLLGERVDASALLEAGALTHVVAPTALDATVEAVVEALQSGAALSQRAHRAFFRALDRGDLDEETLRTHAAARAEAYAAIRAAKANAR
ncbi:MAG: enoyl-CoA hydratase/isomerase family protein [Myxococcota bacterium]